MAKVRKEDKLPLKLKQLGKIYQLIEQFEEISRIDLSKLSRLAPATITALTRQLIDEKLIIERAVQNTESRGRPAVGLCVSPFYWQSICAILIEDHFDILLCGLDGAPIEQAIYPLHSDDFEHLDQFLLNCVQHFMSNIQSKLNHPMTFSIAVAGELDKSTQNLVRLGKRTLDLNLRALFEPHFDIPILMTEYFQTWLYAENTLGSVIGCDNVLFLQLDDVINLGVLIQGELLYHKEYKKINIDKLIVPKDNLLQELINIHLPELERYQLTNQITHKAIYQLIDQLYPKNVLANKNDKIQFLCQKANDGDKSAVNILYFIADTLAYVLMNLVNIFSSEKIMFSSSLLSAKEIFLPRLNATLAKNLVNTPHQAEVVVSQYQWNSPIVLTSAIKQGIYNGSLLKHLIKSET
ncbi:MAG: ROK family protein [[Pasteurella] mairii]|uniref:Protein Mlc n=1 Tax=[Pasteurella] mairii TaxID=757 RepID=A0A379B5C8_9PAST|nr:ROK family protein [[Pasteurella] mairii]SUB33250.1 protein Mlc [[Pasteurella] mairii]